VTRSKRKSILGDERAEGCCDRPQVQSDCSGGVLSAAREPREFGRGAPLCGRHECVAARLPAAIMGQLRAQHERDAQQRFVLPVKKGTKPPTLRKLNESSTTDASIRRSITSGVPETQVCVS